MAAFLFSCLITENKAEGGLSNWNRGIGSGCEVSATGFSALKLGFTAPLDPNSNELSKAKGRHVNRFDRSRRKELGMGRKRVHLLIRRTPSLEWKDGQLLPNT